MEDVAPIIKKKLFYLLNLKYIWTDAFKPSLIKRILG